MHKIAVRVAGVAHPFNNLPQVLQVLDEHQLAPERM